MKRFLKALVNSVLNLVLILLTVGVGAQLFESFIYDYKGSSVVKITRTEKGRSGGTGFQITAPSGARFTLTNAHICRMNNELVAHKQNGDTQKINVIEIFKDHDLCIMEPVEGLRPLSIAKSIQMHERVWLIGHPALRGLTLESGHFVGDMEINLRTDCNPIQIKENQLKLKKLLTKKNPSDQDVADMLQYIFQICTKKLMSQHINNIAYGGNSGSPVVDKFGNVIGVLFAGSPSQPTASHTVPLAEILKFLKDK